MKVLINHIGYEPDLDKFGLLNLETQQQVEQTKQIKLTNIELGLSKPLNFSVIGEIENWQTGFYIRFDFSFECQPGKYMIEANINHKALRSNVFEIAPKLYQKQLMPELLHYFNQQRCRDQYQQKDQSIGFFGESRDNVNVQGGWYDASGDYSKYLSHLNYANVMNPQQSPMVVYNLITALEKCQQDQKTALLNEAIWGADFLVNMFDPAGYFYVCVFDNWSHETEKRTICSYQTQEGIKDNKYQAGFRQGAGMAIAALAKVSRMLKHRVDQAPATEQTQLIKKSNEYSLIAQIAFQHLQNHNLTYLDDGKENIIDDYCALMAVVELEKLCPQQSFKKESDRRANQLMSRLWEDQNYQGWFKADDEGKRSFFHAADEGLPIIALFEYLTLSHIEEKQRQTVLSHLSQHGQFYLSISQDNGFYYPKQYHVINGEKQTGFFFYQNNETGYWWQGENARLASLAYAFSLLIKEFPSLNPLKKHQIGALSWVLGFNPFNMCMVHGIGHNNPSAYHQNSRHIRGGICNGITAKMHQTSGIDFAPTNDDMHAWRWQEQWLPHSSWMLLAVLT